MIAAKLIPLAGSLAFLGVDLSLAATIATSAPASTTSSCTSPNARCGVESQWQGGFFGQKKGLTAPRQCLDFCNAPRTWGVCKSFQWYDDTGLCLIATKPASEVSKPKAGTGVWAWDKECWDCGETPTGNIPTPTISVPTSTASCLPPTAKCEVQGRWKGGEDLKNWGRAEILRGDEGPFGCWEICTDARRPPRCKSFSFDPEAAVCLMYNFTVDESHDIEPGSGLYLWDIDCWTCGVTGYS